MKQTSCIKIFAAASAAAVCSLSHAQISGDIYWRHLGAENHTNKQYETRWDNQTIYGYDDGGGMKQIQAGDVVDWANCNIIIDQKVNNQDWIKSPWNTDLTVKNLTFAAIDGGHMWLNGSDNANAGNLNITGTWTISTQMSGSVNGNYGVSAGKIVINKGAGYADGQYVGFGTDCYSAPGNEGFSFLKVAGDIDVNGAVRMSTNFKGSIDAPSMVVGGVVNMNAVDGAQPTWDFQFQGAAADGLANRYFQVGGINGGGTLQANTTHQGNRSVGYLVLTNKAGTSSEFIGTLRQGDRYVNKDASMNIIMKGEGTQILRAVAGNEDTDTVKDNWYGTLTVEKGRFLYNADSKTQYALELKGGSFGIVGANAGEDVGSTAVESFNWDSGTLIVNNAGASSMSVLHVKGDLALGAASGLAIRFEGGLGEGDIVSLDDFLVFEGFTAAADKAAMEGALSGGEMSVFVGDQQHGYSYDSATGLTILGAIPEPAAIAAIFGALALGLALYRRRG